MTPAPALRTHHVCPLKGCNAKLKRIDGETFHPGYTFNGWWGCQKVAPECEHCYAETWDARWGGEHWGPGDRKLLSDANWRKPLKWDRHAEQLGIRLKVFCMSMGDVWEDRRDLDEPRARLFATWAATPHLDWLVLTKRPQNIRRLWVGRDWDAPAPRNVWLGASAGTQKRAVEVVPELLDVPAVVHFLSVEPMLEEMDLRDLVMVSPAGPDDYTPRVALNALNGYVSGPDEVLDARIKWVIAGSESGSGAREAEVGWYRFLKEQCVAEGAAFFLKQFARNGIKVPLPMLDGERWYQMPEVR